MEDLVMSKSTPTKKNKVPKITEEEYANYLSLLKGETDNKEVKPEKIIKNQPIK